MPNRIGRGWVSGSSGTFSPFLGSVVEWKKKKKTNGNRIRSGGGGSGGGGRLGQRDMAFAPVCDYQSSFKTSGINQIESRSSSSNARMRKTSFPSKNVCEKMETENIPIHLHSSFSFCVLMLLPHHGPTFTWKTTTIAPDGIQFVNQEKKRPAGQQSLRPAASCNQLTLQFIWIYHLLLFTVELFLFCQLGVDDYKMQSSE